MPEGIEGRYRELAKGIAKGHEVRGQTLLAGGRRVEFAPANMGYDIRMDGVHLGATTDNYFLVFLTELFEGDVQDAPRRLRELSRDRRLIQATELQGGIRREEGAYLVGDRRVGYSTTYFECSCPDWKYRRRLGGCKHIAALRLFDV